MLELPQKGILRSITAHRSKLDVVCDWIEGSALLTDAEELSQSDVIDVLTTEQGIYDSQEFCSELVTLAWAELRRRLGWIGTGSPLSFVSQRLVKTKDWQAVPAHSFCLLLSLAPNYSDWSNHFGSDYTEQGAIFEHVVYESMCLQFGGWKITATGWSRDRTSSLVDVVPALAKELGEDVGDIEKWGGTEAHESGLDIAWHLPFADARGGFPVFLGQCASGADWRKKLHTPEIEVWTRLIQFKYDPAKVFALPFALMGDTFVRRSPQVSGLLLDRYRLLSPAALDSDWLSEELKNRIIAWSEPRISWLVSLNK